MNDHAKKIPLLPFIIFIPVSPIISFRILWASSEIDMAIIYFAVDMEWWEFDSPKETSSAGFYL